MTYFDKTRSKMSAIKEGETDVIDIADEQRAEDARRELMCDQSEREDAAYLRNLICIGRYVNGPGMMTLEEHKDALDAIDATPEERQEYNYRVLQDEHARNKARRREEILLEDLFDDNVRLESRYGRSVPPRSSMA